MGFRNIIEQNSKSHILEDKGTTLIRIAKRLAICRPIPS